MKARTGVKVSFYDIGVFILRVVEHQTWDNASQIVKKSFMRAVDNNEVRKLQAMRYVLKKHTSENQKEAVDFMDESTLLVYLTYLYFEAEEQLDKAIADISESTENEKS